VRNFCDGYVPVGAEQAAKFAVLVVFVNGAEDSIFLKRGSIFPEINSINGTVTAAHALDNLGAMIFCEFGTRTATEQNRGDAQCENLKFHLITFRIPPLATIARQTVPANWRESLVTDAKKAGDGRADSRPRDGEVQGRQGNGGRSLEAVTEAKSKRHPEIIRVPL
jgi:hypothetical protein